MIATEARNLRSALKKRGRKELESLVCMVYALEQKKKDPVLKHRSKYYDKPLDWVHDFVIIKLPPYIESTLRDIQGGEQKIAFYGPHGIGKTVLASLLVLWAVAVSEDCKVVTTASAWRQLTRYLWPEIHKWYQKINWEAIGFYPELLTMEVRHGAANAFPVACTNSATIEGAHAGRIVYVYDEAKTIPGATWEASTGAFSTPGHHLQIALSTPGETEGVFYTICSRKNGYESWKIKYVSLRQAIRAGRISLQWARDCRKAWGVSNPVYQNRVWGLFAQQSTDSLIPLSWIDAAVQRWYAWKESGSILQGKKTLGVDVARGGSDDMIMAPRHGKVIPELILIPKGQSKDTMQTTGKIAAMMQADPEIVARIDVIGVGAGVVDRLREMFEKERVVALNAAEKTNLTDVTGELKFANIRAAMWWNMRCLLDPANGNDICLPDNPNLIGDLCAPKQGTTSNGAILIESKESIRERIGRSTDAGDAVVQALFDGLDKSTEYLWVA